LGVASAHDLESIPPSPISSGVPIAGHFSLLSSDNKLINEKSYENKYKLIFFGYTSCRDVCNKMMFDVKVAMQELGKEADLVQPIFITLDPQRDTAKIIDDYVAQFDKRIVGLHGSQSQTDLAVKAFHVFMKTKQIDHAYIIDHSTVLFLMRPDGQFAKLLSGDLPGHKLSESLRAEILK